MVGKGCDVFASILPWICSKRAGGQAPLAVTQIKAMKGYQNLHARKLTANAVTPKKTGRVPILEMNSSELTNWNFSGANSNLLLVSGGGHISSLGMKKTLVVSTTETASTPRPMVFCSRNTDSHGLDSLLPSVQDSEADCETSEYRSYYSLSNYPCMVYISYILHLTSF